MGLPATAYAQNALDRVDPVQTDREALANEPVAPPPKPKPTIAVDSPLATVERAPTATRGVLVGAIVVTGLQALAPEAFADIVAENVGQTKDREALALLATTIAKRARSLGYVFASATIEPQRMASGVLVIRIDEGRIDRLRIDGHHNQAVARTLNELVGTGPVKLDALERRLLIAGDVPGMRVYGARFAREDGAGVLVVRVAANRLRARAVLENDGSRPIGPEQLRLDADVASLLSAADELSVTYVTTPFEPGELNYGRVRYATRVSSAGTEIGLVATVSATDPGAYLEDSGIEGRSWFAGVNVLQPLVRSRDTSLWFEGDLGVRTLRQYRADILARHDRVVALRAGLYGHTQWAGGRLRANVTVSQGLSLLDATQIGDPLASRRDASATFTTLTSWADWIATLGGPVSMRLAVRSQLSTDPLLISEEIGIGGGAFLRGYNYNERSGDQGAMAMGELRYDWKEPLGGLVRRSQFYAFADGGKVTNLADGRGSGSLASGGGGVRTLVTRGLNADFELAVPLSGPRYDTGNADPRFNFRLAKSF
ncbi:ShlB/FhaC/HecB family hemolysin secretion/activation protein [Sphingomonas qomolangmaensis]|uniref:ShlB/FhaC/HecB family hemolysin secretion/activation protein n=1 Tax=Sphingomonas qomolangmaensis TaxID=2918765 RepID=A0ABY5L5S0_9SPHN|nr:ShlB/FhaC/HecB family hemolysin secretion/activation protein [Sphingomonas qomolangmaensis]UUL81413.1 hypothetical protein NMP03_09300 [Sphingomonas qomolangmaensis]